MKKLILFLLITLVPVNPACPANIVNGTALGSVDGVNSPAAVNGVAFSYYLLNDTFTTDLAAGAVDGTAAEPGPGGNRVAADPNSLLSLSGGKAVFAAGAGWADPGLFYSVRTRTTGLTFLNQFNISAFGVGPGIGWNNNQTGQSAASTCYQISGNLYQYETFGATNTLIVNLDVSTDYTLAVSLRTYGGFYLIKGGTYAHWSLVGVAQADNAAPLYPYCINNSSTFTSDYARIPTQLWWPLPIAGDAFTGTWPTTDGKGHWYASDGTDLNSAEGLGGAGLTWTSASATWAIVAGQAVNTPLAAGDNFAFLPAATTPNVRISADLWQTVGTVGIFINCDSASNPQNYIKIYHDGTNVKADEVVGGGAPSNKLSGAAAYVAGATIVVVKESDTTIRVFYNNAPVGPVTTVTSNNGLIHGMYSDNLLNSLKNVVVYARGNEGQYVTLDQYIN